MDLRNKTIIAWGAGNAFMNAMTSFPVGIDYVVDDYLAGEKVGSYPIHPVQRVLKEQKKHILIVIFTYSSDDFQKICTKLTALGFFHGEHFVDYSEIIKDRFAKDIASRCGIDLSNDWFRVISSLFAMLPVKNHSSILGTWLIWGLLDRTRGLNGNAVELGVYEGGNAYYAALFMALHADFRTYYLVDSYNGFPEMSAYDPLEMKDKFKDNSTADVKKRFVQFPNFKVVKGIIPTILDTFDQQDYSFVYYDCDLYKPAMASLAHFYPRLSIGGVFLIDDYCVHKDFLGVRKAVDEFCSQHGIAVIEIPETSHALIIKKP